MSTPTWTETFVAAGEALEALAGSLTQEQLGTGVPATPLWTALEVYAHLAGVGTSVVTGAMAGAPGPDWTAAHVAQRQGRALSDLVAEIRACESEVAGIIAQAHRPAIVWDRVVHLADITEALGLEPLAQPLWERILTSFAERAFRELPLTVRAGEWTFGAGGPLVTVDPYELFRIHFSRRSRAQVQAVFGDVLTAEQQDALQIFGPQ